MYIATCILWTLSNNKVYLILSYLNNNDDCDGACDDDDDDDDNDDDDYDDKDNGSNAANSANAIANINAVADAITNADVQ